MLFIKDLFEYFKPIAIIEYNGEQHYEPVDFAGKGIKWAKEILRLTQKRDSIKKEYLLEKQIPLLVIPYWDYDNMERLIDDFMYSLLQV